MSTRGSRGVLDTSQQKTYIKEEEKKTGDQHTLMKLVELRENTLSESAT